MMKLHKRFILLAFLAVIGLGIGLAFFYADAMVTRWVHDKAEAVLQTEVAFADAELDFKSSSVTLRQVSIYHPDRKQEKLGEIPVMRVRLKNLADLFNDVQPVELFLENPKIKFITTRNGDWELSDRVPLIRRGTNEAPLAPFDVEEIFVENGELEFRDGRMGTVIKLSNIQFHAKNFREASAAKSLPVEFEAGFALGNSGKMEAKGNGDFLSPKTSFQADLKAEGLPLPPYAAYYESGLPVRVRAGSAYFNTKAKCEQDKLRIPIHASVSGLKVELKKNKKFGFVADYKIDSMKDAQGMVTADLLITGDLRRPSIAFLTKFDADASLGMKAVGSKVKSGFGKVKDFFSGK